VLAGLNTRGRGSNRGEARAGLGPAAGRHPAVVRVSGAGAPLPDGTDSHRRTCPTRSRGHRGRPRGLLTLLALDGQAFRLLRSWAINSPRWPPNREAGELDPNVDPTVALVAIHALVVRHALFRAQFARELWIEPDASTTGSPWWLLGCSVLSIRCAGSPETREHPVTVNNRLAGMIHRALHRAPAHLHRQAHTVAHPGAMSMNAIIGRRDQPKPARLRLRADRGLRAAPLLAGPDRLEHARIQQRRRVAELAAFGDVTQQPAHDLAAAGLGHLWDHVDLPRASDR
jgi:hypothetical protein